MNGVLVMVIFFAIFAVVNVTLVRVAPHFPHWRNKVPSVMIATDLLILFVAMLYSLAIY